MKRKLRKHSLFITQKVGDVLFNGYRDDLTKSLAKFEHFIHELQKYFPIKIDGPSAISPDGTFSLLGQVGIQFVDVL